MLADEDGNRKGVGESRGLPDLLDRDLETVCIDLGKSRGLVQLGAFAVLHQEVLFVNTAGVRVLLDLIACAVVKLS